MVRSVEANERYVIEKEFPDADLCNNIRSKVLLSTAILQISSTTV